MKVLSTPSPLFSGRYLLSEKHFFDCTRLLSAQITNLFDFIWPTATAMWNLRWQVQGYISTRDSSVSVDELHQKFGSAKKIIAPNYYRACVELTWEEQENQFANLLLINTFAIHESWVAQLFETIGQTGKGFEKQVQFPVQPGKPGVEAAIATLTACESIALKESFYPIVSQNPKVCLQELNNLLICYRYFKEVRNSFVHDGGIISENLERASIAYENLRPSDLKAKELPAFFALRKGGPTKLSLRGVVGFLDIILKIATTVDAELSRSEYAEHEFEKRWREMHPARVQLGKNPDKRKNNIGSSIRKCRFPHSKYSIHLENWLSSKGFID